MENDQELDFNTGYEPRNGFCEKCEKLNDLIECQVPDSVLTENLCHDCAKENGYCYCCGVFWAGVSEFDFSKIEGMCPNCVDQVESDLGDEDTWDEFDDDDEWEEFEEEDY